MNTTLTDDKSSLDNQIEKSNSEGHNCMSFASIVTSEYDKESEKVDDSESSKHSEEDSEDEQDIHEAYDLLFKRSLMLKKINRAVLKKVNELELERERESCRVHEMP